MRFVRVVDGGKCPRCGGAVVGSSYWLEPEDMGMVPIMGECAIYPIHGWTDYQCGKCGWEPVFDFASALAKVGRGVSAWARKMLKMLGLSVLSAMVG